MSSENKVEVIDLLAEADIQVLEVSAGLVPVPGPQGIRGEKGDTGPAGPAGRNGENGWDGVDGRDGVPGLPGRDGLDGLDGQRGPAGINGLDGKDGAVGPKGDRGENGLDGAAGATGAKGDGGLQGVKGDRGEPGVKGDTGATGAASTVPGPKGDTGATGAKGDTGAAGAKGDTGAASTVAGPKGDTGAQGIQGIQGAKGDTGEQGIQGVKGDKGDTGPAGPAGSAVAPGDNNQILLNRSGAVAATYFSFDPDAAVLDIGNGTKIRANGLAGNPTIQVQDPYQLAPWRALGQHPGWTSTREWQPQTGTTAYNRAMTVVTTGTATAQAISASRWLAEPTLNYVSAATVGAQASFINSNPLVVSETPKTGGWVVVIRMSVKNYAAGKRWFVGMSNSTATPGDVEPSSLTNIFGVGVDSTDTGVQLISRGTTGAANKAGQPIAPDLGGQNITFTFRCNPGSAHMYCGFNCDGYDWGHNWYGGTPGLWYPKVWVSNGAVASSITLSMNRAYVEYLTEF